MTVSSSVVRTQRKAPQGWLGRDLSERHSWRLELTSQAGDLLVEIARARVAGHEAGGQARDIGALRALTQDLRRRLCAFPGFVVLSGIPLDGLSRDIRNAMLLSLGDCLGRPVSQDRSGTLVARVEDAGADISVATQRGHRSSAALPFHVDRTDVIGLLCVRPAERGGESQLASAYAVHDLLAERAPDLLEELYQPLPNDRRGEELPGEAPWIPMRVFSELNSHLVTRYVRRFIEGSQRFDDAPKLTERQRDALDALDAILAEPGVALRMSLARGELQLIDNYSVWHARSSFDSTVGGDRLLLRLWLATPDSPALPASFAPLYGSVAPGSVRGGVWPVDALPDDLGDLVRPVLATNPVSAG
jgi:hypothetical protein